jgi:hypothetical protein
MKQRIYDFGRRSRVVVADLGPELLTAALLIALVALVHHALEVDTAQAISALPTIY